MKVSEIKKALETADDDAEIKVYDSDGNEWNVWNTHYFVGKKVFQLNLY